MARIFVSYSHKNTDFCKRLTDGLLLKQEMDFWVDWEGIPPTVDWMKEIEKGIEEADTFLAIVTPEWIASKVCKDELAIAVKNGKRMIPVVAYKGDWNDVPPALAQFNYIPFTEDFDYNAQLDKLFTALNTDYEWLKTHRRLQVKALEWERSNKEGGFLLHGRDLDEAEQQISINANKDPHPTDIQREYVLVSRQGATRQRRRATTILIALIAVMLVAIVMLVRPYVEEAVAKAQAQDQSEIATVPAGSIDFQLGGTVQTVDLPEYSIELHPVTNKVYGLCVKVSKCTPPIGSNNTQKPEDPVVWLTIVQAATYCEWVDRRLPSAPEWEHAAQLLANSDLNDERFSLSEHYEWTSSYKQPISQGISGDWDGQIGSLNIDWVFLQEKGGFSSTGDLELNTNPSGAFGANEDLAFRCANK